MITREAKRALPFTALAAIVAILTQIQPSADVAWQMWIGRELSKGAQLYRDIVEINPPLWFWLAVPIVRIAALLHLSGPTVLIVFLGLCAAVSLLFSSPSWRLPMTIAFFIAGISSTGEREQFTLITVTPYVLLCAVRTEGARVTLLKAVTVGIWAALGIALKPFFALVPAFLGIWVLLRTGRLQPETLAVLGICAVYAFAVLALCPDYLAALKLAGRYYGIYNVGPLTLLMSDAVAISLLVFSGLLLLEKRDEEIKALAIAGGAFLLAYLLQKKGFRYQGLPAIGLLCLAALRSLQARLAAIPLTLALIVTLATTARQWSIPDPDTMRATADLPRGSRVLVLSPYVTPSWPLIELRGFKWDSPYMFMWMHENRALTARIANTDIREHPRRIIVDSRLDIPLDLSGYQRGPTYGRFATFDPR